MSPVASDRLVGARSDGGDRSAGFSITEVLVVVAIIVILTIIAVPAFRAMIDSSEEAMAESMLRTSVRAGRDAAIRSTEGADGAAVVFYEPGAGGGRTVIVPYVKVAVFSDVVFPETASPGSPMPTISREIFVPDPQGYPVQLPRGWMLRAYAPTGTLEQDPEGTGWYNEAGSNVAQRYELRDNWVFPETAFFDSARRNDGIHRNTFMLRFRGGTGEFVTSSGDSVLIFAPNMDSRGTGGLLGGASLPGPLRELRVSDPARYVRAVISGVFGSGTSAQSFQAGERSSFVGRMSSDMILARPVTQVALYRERDLAAALGIELDRQTGSLYRAPKISEDNSTLDLPPGPALVADYSELGTRARLWTRINRWIEGDTNGDQQYLVNDATDRDRLDVVTSRLYGLDRYTGALRPLSMARFAQ